MRSSAKLFFATVTCVLVVAGLSFVACGDSEPAGPDDGDVLCPCMASAVTPSDNDTINQDSVFLHWSFTLTDECQNPDRYTAHLAAGDDFDYVGAVWTDADSCLFNDLIMDTVYHWWVVSRPEQAGCDTVVSDTWCFHTERDENWVEPIYAQFEIDAWYSGEETHSDEVRARFDSVYAPDGWIEPIQTFEVDFWMPEDTVSLLTFASYYRYTDPEPYLHLGTTYTFHVTRDPNTYDFSLTMPPCAPIVTAPESWDNVPLTGFDVEWTGTECGGMVWLTFMWRVPPWYNDTDSTTLWIYTENDGSCFVPEQSLEVLEDGLYDIVLIKQVEEPIDTTGWMPQCFIRARAYSIMESVWIAGPLIPAKQTVSDEN